MKENIKSGRIILSRKGYFNVEYEGGICVCKAATRLRNEKKEPLCGDIVKFEDNGDKTGFIVDIDERKNCFPRPYVANADLLVIVVASSDPEPDLFYIDKLTCVGVQCNVETVLVVNKNDLKSGEYIKQIYEKCGFKVFVTDNCGLGINELKKFISDKISVFAGPSGVGKSSLIKLMYPSADLEIGELSAKINRGKNTTRHTQLFKTEGKGYIADTPGFTSLDFENYDLLREDDLEYCFPEFEKYRDKCKFRGCGHTKEIGCAVIEAVQNGEIPENRRESYVKLFDILKNKRIY